MVAPSISATVTPIFAPVNNTNAGVNTPVAPTYPGVISAVLNRSGTGATLLVSGRAGQFQDAPGNAAVTIGGGFTNGLPLDMTNGYIVGALSQNRSEGLGTIAQNGLVLALRSGVGNWRRWVVGGSDETFENFLTPSPNSYYPLVVQPSLPGDFPDDGVFDLTAIDLIELHLFQAVDDQIDVLADEFFYIDGPITINGGEVGDLATIASISEAFSANLAATYPSAIFFQSGSQFFSLYFPELVVDADEFNHLFNLDFVSGVQSIRVADANRQFSINVAAGDNFTVQSTSKVISAANLPIAITNAGTVAFDGVVVTGPGAFTVPAGETFIGVGLNARNTTTVAGTLSGATTSNSIDTGAAVLLQPGGSYLGGQIQDSAAVGLSYDIAGANATLSTNLTATVLNNGTNDIRIENSAPVTGSTYAVDISGLNKGAGSTTPVPIFVNDPDPDNTYTVSVNGTFSQADAGSAGAVVNVVAPQNTLTFTGMPTGANENAIAYNSVLAVRNTNDATLQTYDASSGTVAVVLGTIGDGVGPFDVWADGVGFRRTQAQSFTAATPTSTIDLSPGIQEFRNEGGQALVGLDGSTPATGVSFNAALSTFEFAFQSGGYQLIDVFYQKEVITSSQAGQAFDNDAVRAIELVVNDAYKRLFIPPTLFVAMDAAATSGSLITDGIILTTDTTDPRNYGLGRPVLRFAFTVSEAVVTLPIIR